VYARGQGIVLFEPSVIAIEERSGKVLAVGAEAKRMIGRTPASISATRPLRHGVIADFDVTEQMLRHFMRRAIGKSCCAPARDSLRAERLDPARAGRSRASSARGWCTRRLPD
jgi:rod shape-determining protein MreB